MVITTSLFRSELISIMETPIFYRKSKVSTRALRARRSLLQSTEAVRRSISNRSWFRLSCRSTICQFATIDSRRCRVINERMRQFRTMGKALMCRQHSQMPSQEFQDELLGLQTLITTITLLSPKARAETLTRFFSQSWRIVIRTLQRSLQRNMDRKAT